ncbi:hypothetical protein L1887_15042 [Cichorium endivia]|nr:hypothetical protein L1887_15042 [Cichorium endivia]
MELGKGHQEKLEKKLRSAQKQVEAKTSGSRSRFILGSLSWGCSFCPKVVEFGFAVSLRLCFGGSLWCFFLACSEFMALIWLFFYLISGVVCLLDDFAPDDAFRSLASQILYFARLCCVLGLALQRKTFAAGSPPRYFPWCRLSILPLELIWQFAYSPYLGVAAIFLVPVVIGTLCFCSYFFLVSFGLLLVLICCIFSLHVRCFWFASFALAVFNNNSAVLKKRSAIWL